MSGLLPLKEAQERLLALAPQMEEKNYPHWYHPAHYLAADVTAQRTQPEADLSAMDGYAISQGDGPWEKIGESRAGTPFDGALETGKCVRISTGAVVPQGAVSVLIQENARLNGSKVHAESLPKPGQHIRRAGFDFEEGRLLIAKGSLMTPGRRALAIAGGCTSFPGFELPDVAVLESGDELRNPGEQCKTGQIPASNGQMVASMLYPYCGPVEVVGPVRDNHTSLEQALAKLEYPDILITSGGASVGDHDLVQEALERWGARIDFWKVAIKPGKPLLVATRERAGSTPQVILGLPGNPVSSFVTAFLFALPLVRRCMGAANPLPNTIAMVTADDLPATGPRQEFLRGIVSSEGVHLASSQDSSALGALAMADCLINRPAHAEPASKGDNVEVYLL